MAARAAAWSPADVDERTPAVKELRESFVRLQALVCEIEQDKSLFSSEEPLPQASQDVVQKLVPCAPEVGDTEQTKGIDNVGITTFVLFILFNLRR